MKKVLLIEDDPLVGKIYHARMKLDGFQVEWVTDGHYAMAAISRFKPDLVVLDLLLPGLDGIEILRRLRAQRETQTVPVIVFTNIFFSKIVRDANDAGANRCLIKADTTPKLLVETIRELLATAPSSAKSEVSETDPRQDALQNLLALAGSLRSKIPKLLMTGANSERLAILDELGKDIHRLTAHAAIAERRRAARLASAVEALVKELGDDPRKINASSLRTVGQAVELLGELAVALPARDGDEPESLTILAVDDDVFSRTAVARGLGKAGLQAVTVEHPEQAYQLAEQKRFDLIISDVDMPGLNGFELCQKLRRLPQHRNTPVVFVTNLNDFKSRKHASASGGDDFIAKPILLMELAVKVLCHIMRASLAARHEAAGSFVPLSRSS